MVNTPCLRWLGGWFIFEFYSHHMIDIRIWMNTISSRFCWSAMRFTTPNSISSCSFLTTYEISTTTMGDVRNIPRGHNLEGLTTPLNRSYFGMGGYWGFAWLLCTHHIGQALQIWLHVGRDCRSSTAPAIKFHRCGILPIAQGAVQRISPAKLQCLALRAARVRFIT